MPERLTRQYYPGNTFLVKRSTVTRTSASFPTDLWRDIENDRKRRGVPRSRWIQEAVREYLARHGEAERDSRYFVGYRAMPDKGDEDFKAIERAGIEDLKKRADEVARPTERGEVWSARIDTLRPVVIASRNDLDGVRAQTTVAVVTTRVRGIPTEVTLDQRDGFESACAINCDMLVTIDKTRLERRRGALSVTRLAELDDALRFALQLR